MVVSLRARRDSLEVALRAKIALSTAKCAAFLIGSLPGMVLGASSSESEQAAKQAEPLPAESDDSDAAEAQSRKASLSGPNQVDTQIADDGLLVPHWDLEVTNPYHGFKAKLKKDTGVSYGIDYSALGFGATGSPGEDYSASGMVRLYGSWNFIDRGGSSEGGLVFKVEHRHAYTDVAPGSFGFNIGYVGLEEPPFSDQGFRMTNLYYRQTFADKRFIFLAGFVDATDYVDVYSLASPWTHFMNFAFSTGSGSLGVPNEGFGFGLGAWITDNVYGIASLNDLNSDPSKPWETFGRFFSEHQYFKSVELGWTTGRDRAYFDNLHLTAWHVDEKNLNGDPNGWGLNASASWLFADSLMPFLRGGYAQEGGTLYEGTVSAGAAYQSVPGQDVVGLGLNWSLPNSASFGPGLSSQFSGELFYRWQATKEFALTPDAQLLINPALRPDTEFAFVGGLRARLAL